MQLLIKQRVFSWGNKFDIYDQAGNPVFFCRGEVFTLGHKLRIYDQSGAELVYISQQLFRLLPRFDISIQGNHFVTLIQKFKLLKPEFYFDGLDWQIFGDFWAHNYEIRSGNEIVVTISKAWLSWGDTYVLNINEKFNPVLVLAACIIIDCISHNGN